MHDYYVGPAIVRESAFLDGFALILEAKLFDYYRRKLG